MIQNSKPVCITMFRCFSVIAKLYENNPKTFFYFGQTQLLFQQYVWSRYIYTKLFIISQVSVDVT